MTAWRTTGTIEPGLYYETAWVRYNGGGGLGDAGESFMHQQTTTIDPSLLMSISTTTTEGEPVAYNVQLGSISPTTVWFWFVCPAGRAERVGYDVVGRDLTFYFDDTDGPYSYTLSRQ